MAVPAIPPSPPFALKQAGPLTHPGYVVGRWYWDRRCYFNAGSAIIALNTRLSPFYVAYPVTISDLGVQITTLSAGGNIVLAVYASDPTTHLPTGAALAVTGNISTAATGMVSGDITGADVALAPGWYWGAVQADNGTVVLSAPATAFCDYMATMGSTTLANLASGPRGCQTVSSTFGTFPNVTSTPTSEAAINYHLIAFKVSG